MAETKTTSRERTNFSKIRTAIQIPNLIEVQKKSYERFLQMNMLPEEREDTGLQAVFNSVFPISDGVADEFESGYAAKIRNRKHGVEDSLQTGVIAFLRKHVHLEEPFVGILLHLDEIRNLDRRSDLGKIRSLSGGRLDVRHFIECS